MIFRDFFTQKGALFYAGKSAEKQAKAGVKKAPNAALFRRCYNLFTTSVFCAVSALLRRFFLRVTLKAQQLRIGELN